MKRRAGFIIGRYLKEKVEMSVTVQMELSKVTKGAIQYKETGHEDDPMFLIGTLYLRKAGLMYHFTLDEADWPEKIVIEVAPRVAGG